MGLALLVLLLLLFVVVVAGATYMAVKLNSKDKNR